MITSPFNKYSISYLAAFVIVLMFAFAGESYAQKGGYKLSTSSKKAINHFDQATDLYNNRKDQAAADELKRAIEIDPNFIEARIMYADVLSDLKQYNESIAQYQECISQKADFFAQVYYNMAGVQLAIGKYEDAHKNLTYFLTTPKLHPEVKAKAEKKLNIATFGKKAILNPVPFNPINLGPNVNSEDYEYFPAITADEQTLVITRNRRDENKGMAFQEDFYISSLVNGKWTLARNIGPPINTLNNEGAQCISPDGMWLFFTGCNRKEDGLGSCDIYFSQKKGEGWTVPLNIGQPVNSSKWETQPSISPDGKTLYFVSNRAGGLGEADIYQSTLQADGKWGVPVNMGAKINTPGQEESPFIHPDNQTLYFSSNGHPGMGGKDIYMVRRTPTGEWGDPVNLGYPINTYNDENSLIVGASGTTAYFASDREGGLGKLDLYSFELYEAARPLRVTYLKGKVFDITTKKPLEARFELIDLDTKKVIVESFSNPGNGEFLVCLPSNKDYALNVSKDGYLFYSDNFTLKKDISAQTPVLKDVGLQPIKVGEKVVLKNIFFKTGSFDLLEESKVELNKLVDFMTQNSKLKIEISGHTDNVGDDKLNQVLSENRARVVVEYLVSNGIPQERMTHKGYGKTSPVDTNDTEAGRANNRRTEFKITSN